MKTSLDSELENIFITALKNLLEEQRKLEYPKGYELIQASSSYPIELKSSLQYELPFTEKILRNIVKTIHDNPEYKKVIGTSFGSEVPYPDKYYGWEDSKLDLGLKLVKGKYFEFPIEVKIWYAGNSADHVWADIFKLYGYQAKEHSDVGKRKFMFIQYSTNYVTNLSAKTKENILKTIQEEFLPTGFVNLYDTFFPFLTQKCNWGEVVAREVLNDAFKNRNIYTDFIKFNPSYLITDEEDNHYFFLELG